MRKYMVMGAALFVAFAFTSCKSQESAYKKMYEKAQAQEAQSQTAQATQPAVDQIVSVRPLVVTPADQSTVVKADDTPVRQESVTLIDGTGLQQYSVVVGSFGLKTNAIGFQGTLKQAGYDAQVVYNAKVNMYRVICGTYVDKSAAVQSRNAIRGSKFNKTGDAWLLYKN
ncbi:MAG: SPOR domain-containing protein [Prevotellaceae bacterium]|nr:SPOR domain-containing protein [Prevotellaceae bacterium]